MSPALAIALKVVHIAGIIAWVGGMLAGLCAAVAAKTAPEASRTHVVTAARSALVTVATPGLLMAWAAGLWIALAGWDSYRTMGWLHAKITIALVLAAVHGMALARMRKAASGGELKASLLTALLGASLLLALGAVTLVVAQPF
ncbi:MAG: CopD family protein [Deltaproteobacteria bacterium]|nr:CopD family protein [Deltaproteobacteria bacterium]